jgi:hypothetical protein
MSAKYIPLQECVAEFLYQYDKSTGDMDKAWVFAYRGLESMHFNIASEPKTIRIPVLANKTVMFPNDYVSWVKIGLLNEQGEVVTLRVNNSLSTFRDDNPNRLSLLTADVNNGINDGDFAGAYINYWNGVGYQPLYGVGHGIQEFGTCRVDETNNLILLGTDFKYDSIILEYISCPQKDTDYKIDRRLREPLISFIAWKFKLDTDTNYYARLTESRRMISPFNLQTFNQVIREQNKFSLKM